MTEQLSHAQRTPAASFKRPSRHLAPGFAANSEGAQETDFIRSECLVTVS
jgi:hypothetical protein